MSELTEKEFRDMYTKGPDGLWVVNSTLRKSPMSVETWSRSIATLVKQFVGAEIARLEQRLAQIERRELDLVDPLTGLAERIEALEAREERTLADCYQGGHSPNTTYKRGAVISHSGGLWLAMSQTSERPGSTPAWRLILRSER